jgi:hypothetical protein
MELSANIVLHQDEHCLFSPLNLLSRRHIHAINEGVPTLAGDYKQDLVDLHRVLGRILEEASCAFGGRKEKKVVSNCKYLCS